MTNINNRGLTLCQRQTNVKCMNIKEFCDEGYLQEVNRQFFHPLGLALGVEGPNDPNADQMWDLHSVWDYRDDPEGMQFDYRGGTNDPEEAARKAANVRAQQLKLQNSRFKALGFLVEPIPGYTYEV